MKFKYFMTLIINQGVENIFELIYYYFELMKLFIIDMNFVITYRNYIEKIV